MLSKADERGVSVQDNIFRKTLEKPGCILTLLLQGTDFSSFPKGRVRRGQGDHMGSVLPQTARLWEEGRVTQHLLSPWEVRNCKGGWR